MEPDGGDVVGLEMPNDIGERLYSFLRREHDLVMSFILSYIV